MISLEKKAPPGHFRVIGKDNSSDQGWMKGDYTDIDKARKAIECGSGFVMFQIYDDIGECVHSSKTPWR